MLYRSVLTTAVALAGLTSAAPSGSSDADCRSNAVNILLGRCNLAILPFGCLDELQSDVKSFCSTFLTPKTVSKTATGTTTAVVPFTKTATATTTATESATTTTVTVATVTHLATETFTTLTGTTTITVALPATTIPPVDPNARRRDLGPTDCPELNTASLLALGPAKVSLLCKFLGVKPRTTTVTSTKLSTKLTSTTATVTSTTATTTTAVTVETALSLTTTTSVTTTTTSDVATATETSVDYCAGAPSYGPSVIPGLDNSGVEEVVVEGITSPIECCRQCWSGLNCIASIFDGNTCVLLRVTESLDGTTPTDQCPLGPDDDFIFSPGPGPIRLGPCAPPQ